MSPWFDIESSGGLYRIRLKWWHPGLWVAAYRLFRADNTTVFGSFFWTVVLIRVLIATWS